MYICIYVYMYILLKALRDSRRGLAVNSLEKSTTRKIRTYLRAVQLNIHLSTGLTEMAGDLYISINGSGAQKMLERSG